ncbi:hypothetical protein [Tetragenococcus halophilus]|uniref:hypothetical protein n=1 Tax=Tetragenococcus halophilus TaxID=51669 RepID=UPI0030F2352D
MNQKQLQELKQDLSEILEATTIENYREQLNAINLVLKYIAIGEQETNREENKKDYSVKPVEGFSITNEGRKLEKLLSNSGVHNPS